MRDDNIDLEGNAVMQAIESIKQISKHICWVPSKTVELEVWRSFLKGVVEAEGLEVEFEPKVAATDEEVRKGKQGCSDPLVRHLPVIPPDSREGEETRRKEKGPRRDDV